MRVKSLFSNLTMLTAVIGLTVLIVGCSEAVSSQSGHDEGGEAKGQVSQNDASKLYVLVKQARADLREMRIAAGLHAHPAGPHIDPESHHANDSAEQRAREQREGEGHEDGAGGERGHGEGRERGHGEGRERGHGEGRERGHGEGREGREGEHSEEEGNQMAKLQKHDKTYRNGARLILQYNPATHAFIGSVQNTTKETLSQVRVEIHLSNGVELGPTMRTDLDAGATIPVELGAFGQEFSSWVTHPEAGKEAPHGEAEEALEHGRGRGDSERGEHGRGEGRERGHDEGRERGEHGEGESDRPGNASMRPVYNQLQLLRGEMSAFVADVKSKNGESAENHEQEGHEGGEGRGEHRGEGRGEHGGEGRGEHSGEGRGEHGGEGRGEHGREEGREDGTALNLSDTYDVTKYGVRLILEWDAESQSFKGVVKNVSNKELERVRVEVHYMHNNQRFEIGPTTPRKFEPGQSEEVVLKANTADISSWSTHAEVGSEEHRGGGHDEGGERRERQGDGGS